MLEPPQILLHSTSLDIQEEGKTIFILDIFFIWDQKYVFHFWKIELAKSRKVEHLFIFETNGQKGIHIFCPVHTLYLQAK